MNGTSFSSFDFQSLMMFFELFKSLRETTLIRADSKGEKSGRPLGGGKAYRDKLEY